MKFLNVVGARPNFMKIAPFQRELDRRGYDYQLVHTGQHYDEEMSGQFFDVLGMKEPDYQLGVGSASHAVQTARIMERFEPVIDEVDPDWVVVVGDVNSTLAASLVTAKKTPKLAHIEAGIRSGNREMPEEINRGVVDRLADALFCFDEEAVENLKKEGIDTNRIFLVGDIMIDSLHYALGDGEVTDLDVELPDEYGVLTLHRPSNVDTEKDLNRAYKILSSVNESIPLVFSIHPRTRESLKTHGLEEQWENTFTIVPPMNYRDFLVLLSGAKVVLTDSGSIQQETTVMDLPCLTLRDETERAITERRGSNKVVGWNRELIEDSIQKIQRSMWKSADEIPYWDGKTAERIVSELESYNQ